MYNIIFFSTSLLIVILDSLFNKRYTYLACLSFRDKIKISILFIVISLVGVVIPITNIIINTIISYLMFSLANIVIVFLDDNKQIRIKDIYRIFILSNIDFNIRKELTFILIINLLTVIPVYLILTYVILIFISNYTIYLVMLLLYWCLQYWVLGSRKVTYGIEFKALALLHMQLNILYHLYLSSNII